MELRIHFLLMVRAQSRQLTLPLAPETFPGALAWKQKLGPGTQACVN
jgi:hypothetical protein